VEEANNPQRDMPIGILGSLAVCTVIYLTVSGLLTAIAPYDVLNVSSPVAFALLRLGYNWGSALVAIGVIVGLTSTMLVLYYALTRLLFAIARDGLLPPFFSALDKRTHTPANAIVLAGSIMALAAGLVPLGALAELVNAGTLAEFMLVSIGVIVLRLTRPSMHRPFKAPGGMIIPVLAVLSCGALLSFLPLVALARFAIYLAAGLIVYFFYAARHSRAASSNVPDEIAAE
jgi:APA family basic amino acid/polyamine antiporter